MLLIKPRPLEAHRKRTETLTPLCAAPRRLSRKQAGVITCVLLLHSACSGPTIKPPSEIETPIPHVELKTLQSSQESLRAKVEALEARITSLTDKLDAAQMSLSNLLHSKPATLTPVTSSSEHSRLPVVGTAAAMNKAASSDPERGFSSELAVSQYRDARLLFEAKRYPDAIVSFSRFLQQNADHVLAGSAQFFLGECYRQRQEHRLAIQEYQRLLTAYDRSPHVPATLRSLVLSEEALHLNEAATRHRQQLLSFYPQSPSARQLQAKADLSPTATGAGALPSEGSHGVRPEAPHGAPTQAPVPTAPSPDAPEGAAVPKT